MLGSEESIFSQQPKDPTVEGSSQGFSMEGNDDSDAPGFGPPTTNRKQSMGKGWKKLSKGNAENFCHQCKRNNKRRVVSCKNCNKKKYCLGCRTSWYPLVSEQEFEKKCPFCCNNCNCKACLRKEIQKPAYFIKTSDVARHSYYVLRLLLPWLKKLCKDLIIEKEFEARIKGIEPTELKLQEVKHQTDEHVFCNNCRTSIIDFHRNCPNCSYSLCLVCCCEFRQSPILQSGKTSVAKCKDRGTDCIHSETTISRSRIRNPRTNNHSLVKNDTITVDRAVPFGEWKTSNDGTIICPPKELGGCGSSVLELNCMIDEEDLLDLEQRATVIVGSISAEFDEVSGHTSCFTAFQQIESGMLRRAAHRDDSDDNYLYSPSIRDVRKGELNNYQKHWVRGKPVIVRDVLNLTSGLSWAPRVLWRAFRDMTNFKVKSEQVAVKTVNCLNWCEAEMSMDKFCSGYSMGRNHQNGWPEMLKLKDWPPANSFEEGLKRHVIEFISALPFQEYTHPCYGLLNLIDKLPDNAFRTNMWPKIDIAYGHAEELGKGDSVTKLHYHTRDTVIVLAHITEVTLSADQLSNIEKMKRRHKHEDIREHQQLSGKDLKGPERKDDACIVAYNDINGKIVDTNRIPKCKKRRQLVADRTAYEPQSKVGERTELSNQNGMEKETEACRHRELGSLWDIFRKEDVPKLQEYLSKHSSEFRHADCCLEEQVVHPLHDQCFYLTVEHKLKMKDEYGIEPWTFEQHLGEAIFIPAGCPFQVRNLKSCTKVALDFLSPESVGECIRLVEELHLLPEDHKARKDELEVKQMVLYAIRQAVKDLEECIAKPKFKDVWRPVGPLIDSTTRAKSTTNDPLIKVYKRRDKAALIDPKAKGKSTKNESLIKVYKRRDKAALIDLTAKGKSMKNEPLIKLYKWRDKAALIDLTTKGKSTKNEPLIKVYKRRDKAALIAPTANGKGTKIEPFIHVYKRRDKAALIAPTTNGKGTKIEPFIQVYKRRDKAALIAPTANGKGTKIEPFIQVYKRRDKAASASEKQKRNHFAAYVYSTEVEESIMKSDMIEKATLMPKEDT